MTVSRQELIEKLLSVCKMSESVGTLYFEVPLSVADMHRIIADLRFAEWAHQQLEHAESSADVQLQAQNAAHGCTRGG